LVNKWWQMESLLYWSFFVYRSLRCNSTSIKKWWYLASSIEASSSNCGSQWVSLCAMTTIVRGKILLRIREIEKGKDVFVEEGKWESVKRVKNKEREWKTLHIFLLAR
jgi:hypothetical protein